MTDSNKFDKINSKNQKYFQDKENGFTLTPGKHMKRYSLESSSSDETLKIRKMNDEVRNNRTKAKSQKQDLKRCSLPSKKYNNSVKNSINKSVIEDVTKASQVICSNCLRKSLTTPSTILVLNNDDPKTSDEEVEPVKRSRKTNNTLRGDSTLDDTNDNQQALHEVDSVSFDYKQRILTSKGSNSAPVDNFNETNAPTQIFVIKNPKGGKVKKINQESFEDFTQHQTANRVNDDSVITQRADEYKTSVVFKPKTNTKKTLNRTELQESKQVLDGNESDLEDNDLMNYHGANKTVKQSQEKNKQKKNIKIPLKIDEDNNADINNETNYEMDAFSPEPVPNISPKLKTQESMRRKSIALAKDNSFDANRYNDDVTQLENPQGSDRVLSPQTGKIEVNENNIIKFKIENNRISDIFQALKKDVQTLDYMLAYKFLTERFAEIGNYPEFRSLDLRTLLSLLSEKDIKVPKLEKDLFDLLMKWLRSDIPNRLSGLTSLMSHIRFQAMGQADLLRCFEEFNKLGNDANVEACQEWIRKAYWYKECRDRGKIDPGLTTYFPPERVSIKSELGNARLPYSQSPLCNSVGPCNKYAPQCSNLVNPFPILHTGPNIGLQTPHFFMRPPSPIQPISIPQFNPLPPFTDTLGRNTFYSPQLPPGFRNVYQPFNL